MPLRPLLYTGQRDIPQILLVQAVTPERIQFLNLTLLTLCVYTAKHGGDVTVTSSALEPQMSFWDDQLTRFLRLLSHVREEEQPRPNGLQAAVTPAASTWSLRDSGFTANE